MSNYQGLQTQKSKLGTYWFIYDHFIGKSHFFGALCHSNLSQFSQFSCSGMSDSLWPPWTAAGQASLSITNSRSPPKPMSIVLVMPSNHIILYRPLLLLPSIFPSIRAFSNESALHIRWPKYWSFSFNNRPSNEHPGLISFRMDWLDHQMADMKFPPPFHSAGFLKGKDPGYGWQQCIFLLLPDTLILFQGI